MNQESFDTLKDFIERKLGIKIPQSKQIMLESRLAKRVRILGLNSYEEYCSFVFGPEGAKGEIQKLIDAVTTNETDFFRESSHYDLLADQILPDLINDQGQREINIWSVAAATGQEAYTLAMVMENFIQSHKGITYRILATDISDTALNIGETGIYTEHQAKKIPSKDKKAFCMQSKDPSLKSIRFKPYIRAKIQFRHLNLMDANFQIKREYHIVFCRNVFIYFEHSTQVKVLKNVYEHLAPGGYLFMGHSENISSARMDLQSIAAATYRKPAIGNA